MEVEEEEGGCNLATTFQNTMPASSGLSALLQFIIREPKNMRNQTAKRAPLCLNVLSSIQNRINTGFFPLYISSSLTAVDS